MLRVSGKKKKKKNIPKNKLRLTPSRAGWVKGCVCITVLSKYKQWTKEECWMYIKK